MRKLGLIILVILAVLPILLFTRSCGSPIKYLFGDDSLNLQISKDLHAYLDSMDTDTGEITVSVYDLTRSTPVYNLKGEKMMIPASCMKLLTAALAYERLGLDNTYNDSLFISGDLKNGILQGDVILKGQRDPLLRNSDIIIRSLGKAGIRKISGNFLLDTEMEEQMASHWSWAQNDMPESSMGLLFKGTDGISADLQKWLKKYHIILSGRIMKGQAKDDTRLVFSCQNTTKDAMVPMLRKSDNFMAEALTAEMRDLAEEEDISSRFIERKLDLDANSYIIYDGSGLSHENRLNGDFFIKLLRYVYDDRILRDFMLEESLPVAGDPQRHGSLGKRMAESNTCNVIRAKTGTLKSINAVCLAGYAIRNDGRHYCFSILSKGIKGSRDIQDSICKIICNDIRQE